MKAILFILFLITISCQSSNESTSKVPDATVETRKEGCMCMEVWEPVCGENGKTYGNSCEADCNNIKVAKSGEC